MTPNASFWVVPTAAAFAGSAGTMIAVLANVITTAWNAVAVHLMRRDAPFRQRRSTTWVDQSPVLASLVGLLLHLLGPAPAWTADVLTLAGPLLAFSGAALFTGSVIHPHNLAVPQTEHAVRRWGWLTVLRVAYYASSPRGCAGRVDRAGRGGRPHGAERAVVPTHSAVGALRLSLRGRRRRGALGLDPGPAGSRARRHSSARSDRAPLAQSARRVADCGSSFGCRKPPCRTTRRGRHASGRSRPSGSPDCGRPSTGPRNRRAARRG